MNNIIFFLLLLITSFLLDKYIPLSIIYTFTILFFYMRYNLLEGFDACMYNIPSAQINMKPFVILLGSSNSCGNENIITLTIESDLKKFTFNQDIEDLELKLKSGTRVKFGGLKIDSDSVYTIDSVSSNSFIVKEDISIDDYLNYGAIRINYDNINYGDSSLIFNKNGIKSLSTSIDNNSTNSNNNLSKIQTMTNDIQSINNKIKKEYNSIKNNEEQINSNNETILNNNKDIMNKRDISEYLDSSITNIPNDFLQPFNDNYGILKDENVKLKKKNDRLIISINDSEENIKVLKKKKYEKQSNIKVLFEEINKNSNESIQHNKNINIQNNNFNTFKRSCNVKNIEKKIGSGNSTQCS